MSDALLVTAHLAGPLALGPSGEAPHLDALLEYCCAAYHPKAEVRGYKIDRAGPCPAQGIIPIPLARSRIGKWLVGNCSSAIMPHHGGTQTVEHVCKRIATEEAALLATDERKIVSTTNAWTKSYRLPLRVIRIPCIKWFAVGNRREILKLLRKDCHALGKKVSDGYGRVSGWEVERVDEDCSWFVPHPSGRVLMRPLPLDALPPDVVGWKRDFGAVSSPYWHPERATERAVPC